MLDGPGRILAAAILLGAGWAGGAAQAEPEPVTLAQNDAIFFSIDGADGPPATVTGEPPQAAAFGDCPANGDAVVPGVQLDCVCPAGASGDVWGSGPYLGNSALCAAARHAGLIGPDGGQVAVAGSVGCERYPGGAANGVTTHSYDAWQSSFFFPAAGSAACPAREYYSIHFVGLRCLDEADPFFLEDFDSVFAVAFVVEADGAIQEARVLPRDDEWYGRIDAGQVIAQDIRVWQGLAQDVTLNAMLFKYDPVLPDVMRVLVATTSGLGGALIAVGSGGVGAAAGFGAAAAGVVAADEVHRQLSESAAPLGDNQITIELERVGDPASQPLQQAGPVGYHFVTEHSLRGSRYQLLWQVRR